MRSSCSYIFKANRIKALIASVVAIAISSALFFVIPPIVHWLPYLWTRWLHILGGVIFLGNVFLGAFWMIYTDVQKSPELFRFTIRGINATDIAFTAPGALLLMWNGFVLAHQNWGGIFQMNWLRLAFSLFMILGLLWALLLVPLQIYFEYVSENLTAFTEIYQSSAFRRRLGAYFILGSLAGVLTLTIFILMVLKPSF